MNQLIGRRTEQTCFFLEFDDILCRLLCYSGFPWQVPNAGPSRLQKQILIS